MKLRVIRYLLLFIIATHVATSVTYAGDEAEHRHMIYAIALAAGYSASEAKVISDGSWSVDENNSTLALNSSYVQEGADFVRLRLTIAANPDYAALLIANDRAFDDAFLSPNGLLSRIGPAAINHALMTDPRGRVGDPNQPGMNAVYFEYLRAQSKRLEGNLAKDDLKKVQLILLGQYVHQLVDSFVHPEDPLYGHFKKGHKPDLAVYNPQKYTAASFAALRAMKIILPDIRPADDRLKALKLETTEKQLEFCKKLVDTVKDGYSNRRELTPDLVPDAFGPSPAELERIKLNVEKYMNGLFNELGISYKVEIPNFTKVTYNPRGDSFDLYYPGTTARTISVDNVVRWMLGQPQYRDLLNSVRESMRKHLSEWQAQRDTVEKVLKEIVGGVLIRYEIFEKAMATGNSAENGRRLASLSDQLLRAQNPDEQQALFANFVADMKARFKASKPLRKLEGPVAVSLKSLVARAEEFAGKWESLPEEIRHPGGLTGIHGYFFDPRNGDILIFGRHVSGEPLLDLDDLIVGVRSVWREGDTPLVSLDPDPEDFAGPQRVRIQGVPRDSQFARTLIEADYLMKKIMGGVETVTSPGFVNFKQILARVRPGETRNRFWLYPVQPQAGDIQVATDGNSAIFMSGVQVLSEELLQTREGIVGAGRTMGVAEEAAVNFTRYYPDIERQMAVYRKLQGLFDIVLLARVWQTMKIKSPLLDRLTSLPYQRVEIPDSYQGITVSVYQTGAEEYTISGGVQVKLGAGPRTWLVLDDPEVDALRERARSLSDTGAVAASFSNLSLHIPESDNRKRDETSLTLTTAVSMLNAGDTAGAMSEVTKWMRTDPYDPEPLALRALINFYRNDRAAAKQDAFAAREMDAGNSMVTTLTSLVLFQCYVLDGKTNEALQEIEFAIKENPGSVNSRILRANALSQFGRVAEARAELKKAIELDPNSAVAYTRLGMLELGEGWLTTGQKWLKKAEALSKLDVNNPELKAARAIAEMASAAGGNAESHLARATQLAREALANPACDPPSAMLALAVLSGAAMIKEDWNAAEGYVNKARIIAPTNPDLLLYLVDFAHDAKRADLAQKYLAEAERIAPDYPAVKNMRQKIGR